MSKALRKLSLVLGLVVVASVAQAHEPQPADPKPIEPIVQGCCWKRTQLGLVCGAPSTPQTCADNFVANKNCGTPECGG